MPAQPHLADSGAARSLRKLTSVCTSSSLPGTKFLSDVEDTGWLVHVRSILEGAVRVAHALHTYATDHPCTRRQVMPPLHRCGAGRGCRVLVPALWLCCDDGLLRARSPAIRVCVLLFVDTTSRRYRHSGTSVLTHCSDGWDRTSQVCRTVGHGGGGAVCDAPPFLATHLTPFLCVRERSCLPCFQVVALSELLLDPHYRTMQVRRVLS